MNKKNDGESVHSNTAIHPARPEPAKDLKQSDLLPDALIIDGVIWDMRACNIPGL